MSALDIHSEVTIPTEIDYTLPSSLPSARSREVRVSPINGNNFTVSTSSQVLQFDIPCSNPGDYLDPSTTYVRYKIAYSTPQISVSNGALANGTIGTDVFKLIGSSYSFFNLQRVLGNNSTVIEEINEVGVLTSMLYQTQMNDSDNRGMSNSLGFAFDLSAPDTSSATLGHKIYNDTTTQGLSFEYSCPLIGILGSGTTKLIPVGKIFGIRLEMTLDIPANFIAYVGGTANVTSTSLSYTISEIEFVANYITLGPESQMLVDRLNPDKIHIRTQSWKQTAGVLQGLASGTNEILCNIRVNSLKSIYLACSIAGANEKKYSGICPNLGSGSGWLIAGQLYPQRGLDPSTKTADCFTELQKSMGALNCVNYNGCISKPGYYTASTLSGLLQPFNSTSTTSISNPNQFFMGIDTEILQRKNSLLSGVSTYGSGLMFRANITTPLSNNTHSLYFYGFYDVILEVDCMSKTIIAKY